MTTQKTITTVLTISIFIFIIPSLCSFASPLETVAIGKNISLKQQKEILDFFNPSTGKYNLLNIKEKNLTLYKKLLSNTADNKHLSCAYVQPTQKGGLDIKTINLTYMTNWLLSDALIVSNIDNLNAIVASPKQISGLDSFPSVVLAYETSTKETISPEKINLSIHLINLILKISTTENLSQTRLSLIFGIIEERIIAGANIPNTVKSVLENHEIPLTAEETNAIINLMTQINSQSYNKTSMLSALDKLNLKIKCKLQENDQLYGLCNNAIVFLYRIKIKLEDYFAPKVSSNSIFKNINHNSPLAQNAVTTGDSTLVDVLN